MYENKFLLYLVTKLIHYRLDFITAQKQVNEPK
jgi:hypothetical protein